jgi:hypothetical protein
MATVIEAGQPYQSKSGKWVVVIKLAVQPSGKHVWYRPWAGETKDGDFRDNISEFLKAVKRVPQGRNEVDWNKVLGAKGKCRIKVEQYNGEDVNTVGWFYVPKGLPPETKHQDAAKVSVSDFEKARKAQENKTRGGEPEEDSLPY